MSRDRESTSHPGKSARQLLRAVGPPRTGARLGPNEQIRQGWEYRRVYDGGAREHGRAFVVFVQHEPGVARRVGFVAGRRVGNAVQRNRARRLLREAYRRLKGELPAQGFRIVFVARSPCPDLKLSYIDGEMRRLLRRIRLLQPPG